MTDIRRRLRAALFLSMFASLPAWAHDVSARWLTQVLQKIGGGRASRPDFDLLLSVCDRIMGKCLCPLGDSDAIAVLSYVDRFRDEYQAHIDLGRCPFDGESSLEGILAPTEMHAKHGPQATPA